MALRGSDRAKCRCLLHLLDEIAPAPQTPECPDLIGRPTPMPAGMFRGGLRCNAVAAMPSYDRGSTSTDTQLVGTERAAMELKSARTSHRRSR